MTPRVSRFLVRLASKEEPLRRWAQALSISATLAWMSVTFYLLGSPDPPSPEAESWWFPVLAHLFLFAVFGLLVSFMLATLKRSFGWLLSLMTVVVMGFLWGSATELYQATAPTRNASWEDLLLDTGGAVLGGASSKLIGFWISRYLSGHKL